MKNPYKKGKVHPSPSQPPPPVSSPSAAFLSLLPAAILSLTAALSPQDKEVLAYLISSCHVNNHTAAAGQRKASRNKVAAKDHGPAFECSCFRCYTTFWARWDASPNRHVIHDIIEAYEESLSTSSAATSRQKKSKKRAATSSRRKEVEAAVESSAIEQPVTDDASCGGGGEGVVEVDVEKSAVRKIVSFVGDRIIGIFGV